MIGKTSSELTEAARAHLSKKTFAVPPSKSNTGEEAYPIPDRQHARSALGFAKMHGDSADLAAVRKKVEAKYPDMLKAASIGGKLMAGAGGLMQGAGKVVGNHNLMDLAGLGILAAPVADNIQARTRAHFAGDKGENAVERRQLMGEPTHDALELGGLGVLAAPTMRDMIRGIPVHSLPKLAMRATFDELLKIGGISDAQAQAAVNRLDTLERNKPTLGQAARYGAIGGIAAPAVRLLTDAVRHGNPLHGGMRGLASDALGGALMSSAVPMARAYVDRSAEEKTLKRYLTAENQLSPQAGVA